MTSKSSFFRMVLHEITTKIWALFIIAFAFLITLPVYIAGMISGIVERTDSNRLGQMLEIFFRDSAFTPYSNWYATLAMVISAVLLAIAAFSYLNFKSQVDLYHSFPVSRVKLFFVRYLAGILIFLFGFLTNIGLTAVVIAYNGYLNGAVGISLLKSACVYILYFTGIYNFTCIAVIITGNIFCNVIMTAVLLSAEGVAQYVITSFLTLFMKTYYYESGDAYCYFTPLMNMVSRFSLDDRNIMKSFSQGLNSVWIQILMIVISMVTALLCFYYRKSERTGRALVSEKLEYPVKAVVTVLATLMAAYISNDMFASMNFKWFIIGGAITFVLSHIVFEIIFRADFKQAFMHMWHWLADVAIVIVFLLVLYYDVIGYDTYIPDKSDIEYMALEFDGYAEGNHMVYDAETQDGMKYVSSYSQMKLYDFNAIYELVKNRNETFLNMTSRNPWRAESEDVNIYNNNGYSDEFFSDCYETDLEGYKAVLEALKADKTRFCSKCTSVNLNLKYHLSNGSDVYRTITVDLTDPYVVQKIGEIYDTPEFKKSWHNILTSEQLDKFVSRVYVDCAYGYNNKKLNAEDVSRVLTAYREELLNLTFNERITEDAVAEMSLEYQGMEKPDEDIYYFSQYAMPVYPSFTNTIAILKDMGFALDTDNDRYEIESIIVRNDSAIYDDGEYLGVSAQYSRDEYIGALQSGTEVSRDDYATEEISENSNTVSVSEKTDNSEKMKQILECLNNYSYDYIKGNISVVYAEVTVTDRLTNETSSNTYYFKNGMIPDFVIDDLIEQIDIKGER